jgi:predicted kinase
VSAYREHGGDPGGDELVAFFAAHRAWVRANVALLRAGQRSAAGEDPGASRADGEALIALGRRLAWRARGTVVLVVCGLSGSGKSHLARALSATSGVAVVASDPVRKELAGVAVDERAPAGAYSGDFNERTYAELGRRVTELLAEGGAVIVDATFRLPADRAAFAAALGDGAPEPLFVECIAPEAVRLSRVAGRHSDVSDATVEIARSQGFEPFEEVPAQRHLPLRTDRPAAECVAAIESWLDTR